MHASIVIHPGFLKTATTTLQRHLFANHPQLFLFGNHLQGGLHAEIGDACRKLEGVDFENDRLEQLIARALAQRPSGTLAVLSNETFTADPSQSYLIAKRLHDLFPDARILFTIRNQLECISSYYARHGRVLVNAPAPYRNRHVSFENWLDHVYRNFPRSFLGVIDYYKTIRIYEELFGRERIEVLLIESLRDQPDLFHRQLADILGIEPESIRDSIGGRREHLRESASFVLYDRFRKRFIPERLIPAFSRYAAGPARVTRRLIGAGKPHRVEIPDRWRTPLENLYAEGNRSLVASYGLKLEEKGYPC